MTTLILLNVCFQCGNCVTHLRGWQERHISCVSPVGKAISDLHCVHKHKPIKRQRCTHRDCHVIWRTTVWSAVSKTYCQACQQEACARLEAYVLPCEMFFQENFGGKNRNMFGRTSQFLSVFLFIELRALKSCDVYTTPFDFLPCSNGKLSKCCGSHVLV